MNINLIRFPYGVNMRNSTTGQPTSEIYRPLKSSQYGTLAPTEEDSKLLSALPSCTLVDHEHRSVLRFWGYDPLDAAEPNSLDKHGNPNVLTRDKGTSRLAQSPSAQTVLVQVERFEGEAPPITAFEPVE